MYRIEVKTYQDGRKTYLPQFRICDENSTFHISPEWKDINENELSDYILALKIIDYHKSICIPPTIEYIEIK